VFLSNTVCLSTNGGITDAYPVKNNPYYGPNYISKNVLNNRTGIFTENPLSAFHVTGGSLFDGHMTITGNLSVAGDLTRFDTYVYITSSVEINVQNNSNTTPALYVINRGNNKVIAAYDGDVNNPGLIVDGDSSRPGYVGMGVTNPEVRLDIYNNATGTPQSASAATGTVVHVSQADASPSRILVDSFGVASAARPSFTGRHSNGTAAAPTAVQGNDVLCEFTGQGYGTSAYSTTSRGRMKINADEAWTNSAQGTYLSFETTQRGGLITSEVMKISSNGFVGINTTVPNERLTVAGSISAQNNLSAVYIHVAPGMNVNYPSYPNVRASFVSFIDGYAQVNAQNLNSGNAASTDIILTSDNGSDTANYLDLGINSSTYNQAAFNITGVGDGYLYVQNNDLTIGTAGAADTTNDLIFHTGGTTTSQERIRITKTGVTTINNVTNANVSINNASSGTGTTSIHNNTTNTAALAIGNTAAPATVGASTLGITTTGQVDLNSSTAKTSNINTGSGAVTTTIGNAGTVAINGTTNVTGTTTIAGNSTIANTAGNTLTIGNSTGAVTANASTYGLTAASTLDLTSGGTLTINATTGRTSNINTGSGAVTTTIGNNTASNVTVVNSQSVTAPNQTYVDGTSVITGSLGDARYGQQLKYFRTSDLSRLSTTTLANDDVLIIPAASLLANKTYSIECVLNFSSAVITNGARIAFSDASGSVTNVSITDIYGANGTASVAGYTSFVAANNTTIVVTGTTPITFTRKGTFRTGASPGNITLQWAQGTSIATNTTLKAGSYLAATLLG
jgi:hypothetical protein